MAAWRRFHVYLYWRKSCGRACARSWAPCARMNEASYTSPTRTRGRPMRVLSLIAILSTTAALKCGPVVSRRAAVVGLFGLPAAACASNPLDFEGEVRGSVITLAVLFPSALIICFSRDPNR